MEAQLLKMAPSTLHPAVFKLVRVNFLGSPEVKFALEKALRLRLNFDMLIIFLSLLN